MMGRAVVRIPGPERSRIVGNVESDKSLSVVKVDGVVVTGDFGVNRPLFPNPPKLEGDEKKFLGGLTNDRTGSLGTAGTGSGSTGFNSTCFIIVDLGGGGGGWDTIF